MKIRLLSDLHIDINHMYPLDLMEYGLDDMFTLIAGDVSGSPRLTAEWLKKNVHQGAFICGNHDVYETSMPIEDVKSFYHREFPDNGNVVFFDADVGVLAKEIDDDVLLVADVLYTDYNLDGKVQRNIFNADPWRNYIRHGMNDFNFGRTRTRLPGINDRNMADDGICRLVPECYVAHHDRAFAKITEIVESNRDKQILLMTHHGLSPKCLDENYTHDNLDASYVSNKEDWIKSHPNIKCIVSGHVHCRKSFKVGDALYVMNALGYCSQNLMQHDESTNESKMWTPDCVIDTSSWTVSWNLLKNEAWDKQFQKDLEKMLAIYV